MTLYLMLCLPDRQSCFSMKQDSLKESGSKLIIFGALVRRIPEAALITGELQGFRKTGDEAAGPSLTCSWDVALVSATVGDCALSRPHFALTAGWLPGGSGRPTPTGAKCRTLISLPVYLLPVENTQLHCFETTSHYRDSITAFFAHCCIFEHLELGLDLAYRLSTDVCWMNKLHSCIHWTLNVARQGLFLWYCISKASSRIRHIVCDQ